MEGQPTAQTATAMTDDLPPDSEARPYQDVRDRIALALAVTEERLGGLRKQRDDINAEIKLLVDERDLLRRMDKIAKNSKEVRNEQAPDVEPVVHD